MVSIKTLKLLLTIKLRNYYRFHVLPLTSFQKSKNTTKQTQRRKKAKKNVSLVFTKKNKKTSEQQKVTTSWTCLVGHWLSCLNSSSLCAGLNSASLNDKNGVKNICFKDSSWWKNSQDQRKVNVAKKELRSSLPKGLEETEIKIY